MYEFQHHFDFPDLHACSSAVLQKVLILGQPGTLGALILTLHNDLEAIDALEHSYYSNNSLF